jgi:2-polyprenyl-3-methyl-5-hydroxy-6-metoxy-1,4-benzoquinol methylase
MNVAEQRALAAEMLDFLQFTPLSPDLLATRDRDYLFHFEAPRHLIARQFLLDCGIGQQQEFQVLDFGYLHGLTQEFLHRAFSKASLTVYDLPSSPVFKDQSYQDVIRARSYLRLAPRSIGDVDKTEPKYDVITLGEIVEHLDPGRPQPQETAESSQARRCLDRDHAQCFGAL